MISVAVIEDEQKEIENLKKALSRYEEETGTAFRIAVFNDAELFLTNYKPVYDIVFMDIMLPGMNGMQAAHRLRKFDEEVVLLFLTNMAQFAIKGYEVGAIDFVVKPFRYYDLKMRLDRICHSLEKKRPGIKIPVSGGVKSVNIDDINYIETNGHIVTYHMRDGVFTSRGGPMKEIEKQLAPHGFARCSVSFLVNLHQCLEVRGDSLMIGSDTLPISRGKRKQFMKQLQDAMDHK